MIIAFSDLVKKASCVQKSDTSGKKQLQKYGIQSF